MASTTRRVPKIGLQWCPRDPKVEVDGEILDLYCLIPIQYQNKFDSFVFTVYHRKNANTEAIYIEDDVVVVFEEDRDLRRHQVRVECRVEGVPSNTPKLLRVFAPWDDQYVSAESESENVSVSLQLTQGVQ